MGFPFFPMMPMGLRLAALRAAGAPLINCKDTSAIIILQTCFSLVFVNVMEN